MTTVLDKNVHNLAVTGTFDDCQDIVKALFADPDINSTLKLGAVNSINWARILAQIVYYFHAYFSLVKNPSANFKLGDKLRFVVPTGNFGDILAGYFAQRMGLPVEKLVIATNENDILYRFWKNGRYDKKPAPEAQGGGGGGLAADGVQADESGVRGTLSPAMDILVSSNFERLLWFLAYEFAAEAGMDDEWNKRQAGQEVAAWLQDLKTHGGFGVYKAVHLSAQRDFESERVDDAQTVATIKDFYGRLGYILDPHSAVGVAASLRSIERAAAAAEAGKKETTPHISLSTAHPAKFAHAVDKALTGAEGYDFEEKVLPPQFVGMDKREKRVAFVENDWKAVRELVKKQVEEELVAEETAVREEIEADKE